MAHPDAWNSSFKVTISRDHVMKVFDANFWPDGIGCRLFKTQRKRNDEPRSNEYLRKENP